MKSSASEQWGGYRNETIICFFLSTTLTIALTCTAFAASITTRSIDSGAYSFRVATSSVMYTNYRAHYEYAGHVNSPNTASWFNTVGSYDHATIGLSGSPSVSIDMGGNVSASIGLNVAAVTDTRSAELEIHYIP